VLALQLHDRVVLGIEGRRAEDSQEAEPDPVDERSPESGHRILAGHSDHLPRSGVAVFDELRSVLGSSLSVLAEHHYLNIRIGSPNHCVNASTRLTKAAGEALAAPGVATPASRRRWST
jgi:hypothetical protein